MNSDGFRDAEFRSDELVAHALTRTQHFDLSRRELWLSGSTRSFD
jgi:hypothetical protein